MQHKHWGWFRDCECHPALLRGFYVNISRMNYLKHVIYATKLLDTRESRGLIQMYAFLRRYSISRSLIQGDQCSMAGLGTRHGRFPRHTLKMAGLLCWSHFLSVKGGTSVILSRYTYQMFNKSNVNSVVGLALLAELANTQTNNAVYMENRLIIAYGERAIHAPNALVHPGSKFWCRVMLRKRVTDRAGMSNEPNISTPKWSSPWSPATLMVIDHNAAFGDSRVNLLHWLVIDVTLVNGNGSLSSNSPRSLDVPEAQVTYIQPDPPVGDVTHTYQVYLFCLSQMDSLYLNNIAILMRRGYSSILTSF